MGKTSERKSGHRLKDGRACVAHFPFLLGVITKTSIPLNPSPHISCPSGRDETRSTPDAHFGLHKVPVPRLFYADECQNVYVCQLPVFSNHWRMVLQIQQCNQAPEERSKEASRRSFVSGRQIRGQLSYDQTFKRHSPVIVTKLK